MTLMPASRTVAHTSRMLTSWNEPFETSLRTIWLPASMPSASQPMPAFWNSSSADGPHRVDARVGPHAQVQVALDHLLQERLVVAPVEEEHLVADAHRLAAHPRQLLELAGDQGRAPEAHAARIGGMDVLAVVVAVDDVDHAEVAAEVAAERGVDRGERRALGVVEAGVPEVGAVEVERALAVRQQVPGVAGQVLVHPLLRHDRLRLVQPEHRPAFAVALLVADAVDLGDVLP